MKKLLYISLFLLAVSSCTLETSDNGKLDGLWHLERIDTLQTGGATDLSNEKIFWAVENKLLQFQGGPTGTFSFHFTNTGDSLILLSPYRSYGHEENGTGGDQQVMNPSVLKPYGVQRLEEHFFKESLKSSSMVLRSDSLRLYFKKF